MSNSETTKLGQRIMLIGLFAQLLMFGLFLTSALVF
jgi:hypothetical protein